MTLPELARRLRKATSTVYAWADHGVPVNGERVRLATRRIGLASVQGRVQSRPGVDPGASLVRSPRQGASQGKEEATGRTAQSVTAFVTTKHSTA